MGNSFIRLRFCNFGRFSNDTLASRLRTAMARALRSRLVRNKGKSAICGSDRAAAVVAYSSSEFRIER